MIRVRLRFLENCLQRREYPASGSSPGENVLVMSVENARLLALTFNEKFFLVDESQFSLQHSDGIIMSTWSKISFVLKSKRVQPKSSAFPKYYSKDIQQRFEKYEDYNLKMYFQSNISRIY